MTTLLALYFVFMGILVGGAIIDGIFSIATILVASIGFIMYMLPAVFAAYRDHNNVIPIILFSVFFNWTLLGWLISLIWAFTDNVKNEA